MRAVGPFGYSRAGSLAEAVALTRQPGHIAVAGGTELVNWLKEGIARPATVVDIAGLPGLDRIEAGPDGLVLGALARLADVAAEAAVRQGWPAVAQALLAGASPQLRSMATLGGNLLQRTRCPYFRAEAELACNKRRPGSGCAAFGGEDRGMAVFGWSEHCVATHPSDVAVALAALDATVEVAGPGGDRTVPVAALHRLPGDAPERDTVLEPGEIITAVRVPATAVARRSHYLKVRERASYEFALVSAAVGLDLAGGTVRAARVALGGVAPRPWRLPAAEAALAGVAVADAATLRAAVDTGLTDARPLRRNAFKVELAARAAVRALQTAGGVA